MALDYVLANPGQVYLATEHEKVDLLTGRLGIDTAASGSTRSACPGKSTVRETPTRAPTGISWTNFPSRSLRNRSLLPLWFRSLTSTRDRSSRRGWGPGSSSTRVSWGRLRASGLCSWRRRAHHLAREVPDRLEGRWVHPGASRSVAAQPGPRHGLRPGSNRLLACAAGSGFQQPQVCGSPRRREPQAFGSGLSSGRFPSYPEVDRRQDRNHTHPAGSPQRYREPSHLSQSEWDWAYAKRALARGDTRETVVSKIAAYRPDKPRPRYYAEYTVEKAAQSLETKDMKGRTDSIEKQR